MITKITIENFKGISSPVSIELKPITLLFGSNCAGKSTIFHAFLYAYEVFVNRNFNPDRTTLGGDTIDLGGFETFVHQHELDRSIRVAFELDMRSAQLDLEWPIAETLISSGTSNIDLSALGSDVWKSEIDVRIGWDKGTKRPFVMAYKVNLDGEQIVELQCDRPQKGVIAKINYRHPVFLWAGSLDLEIEESIGVLDYLLPMIQTVSDKRFWEEGIEVDFEIFEIAPELTLGNPPTKDAPDLASYRVFEELEEGWKALFFYLLDEEKSKATLQGVFFFGTSKWNELQARELYQELDELDDSFQINLNGLNDALPIPGRSLEIPIGPSESTEYRFIIDLLSRLSIAPLQVLMRELSEMRHIGPLRQIPTRNFRRAYLLIVRDGRAA